MFRTGQKVVCINDLSDVTGRPFVCGLRRGEVYTIRDVLPNFPSARSHGPGDCVRVKEILRDTYDVGDGKGVAGLEVPFWAHRFRPLEEKKTDISIFTAMLKTKTKQKVKS